MGGAARAREWPAAALRRGLGAQLDGCWWVRLVGGVHVRERVGRRQVRVAGEPTERVRPTVISSSPSPCLFQFLYVHLVAPLEVLHT